MPTTENGTNTPDQPRLNPGEITPELVDEVAEKVYLLMRKEMEIERERFSFVSRANNGWAGGRYEG